MIFKKESSKPQNNVPKNKIVIRGSKASIEEESPSRALGNIDMNTYRSRGTSGATSRSTSKASTKRLSSRGTLNDTENTANKFNKLNSKLEPIKVSNTGTTKTDKISSRFEERESLVSRIKKEQGVLKEPRSAVILPPKNVLKNVKKKRSRRKKIFIGIIFVLLIGLSILGGVTYVYVYKPAMRIKASAENIKATTQVIAEDFDKKDLSNLDANINTIRTELDNIDAELLRYEFLADWEYTKGYYDNLQVGRTIIAKSDLLIESTLPELKNVLSATGFKVDNSNNVVVVTDPNFNAAELEEESAINLVLREMPQYLALYETIEPQIIDIMNEVQKINPEYVPPSVGYDVDALLATVKSFSEEFPVISKNTTDFLVYAPELIGSNRPTTYLLVLQNESEMRASGGLITAYGTMTMSEGEVGDISLKDSWTLENYLTADLGIFTGPDSFSFYEEYPAYVSSYGYYQNIYGQAVLMNSGCGATSLRAQDSGIFPDLHWTLETFSDYYDVAHHYDPERFPGYDHMLIINFEFAENLLGLLQPVEVEGFGNVTADTLFDFIKNETDDPSVSFSQDRKKIIEDIANAVKDKLFDLEIRQVEQLLNLTIKSFMARDLAFASPNADLQAYFDKYGMSGRFETSYDGDYFHLNEAQNCSLKLNKFVRDTVYQDIHIGEDGSISKTVRVEWEQPEIYRDELKNHYSPSLSHSYRAWVRFFVPTNIIDPNIYDYDLEIESDGFEQSGYLYYYPVEYYDEVLNKDVSDNIIQFDHRRFSEEDPIPTHELTVEYSLPETLNYNTMGIYKLLIQKHPGKSWGEKYVINIYDKGQQYKIEFTLDEDKVLTYNNGVITIDNYNKKLDWLERLVDDIPFEEL